MLDARLHRLIQPATVPAAPMRGRSGLTPARACKETQMKHVAFPGRLVIVGFGSIGQGVLPLMLRHIDMPADRITIVTAEPRGREVAAEYGIRFVETAADPRQLPRGARAAARRRAISCSTSRSTCRASR